MKKNSTSIFMLVSMLMHLLHVLRGDLSFIVDGELPYILYYGTMVLYVICFSCYTYPVFK